MPTIINDRPLSGVDRAAFLSPQTDSGAINASPVFERVNYRNSGALQKTITTVTDDSIDPDNQGQDTIVDGFSITGEFSTNASKQSIRFLKWALQGATTSTYTQTSTDIEVNAAGELETTGTFTTIPKAGDVLFVKGFTNADNNKMVQVLSATATNIVLTEPLTTEAAGASVTLTSNKMVNGDSPTLFAMQDRIRDLSRADDTAFKTFYDGQIGSLTFTVPESGPLTSDFNVVAEKEVEGYAKISGQTDAPKEVGILSGKKNVKRILINGEGQTCRVVNFSVEVNRNLEEIVLAACPSVYAQGRLSVTGTLNLVTYISNSLKWRENYENQDYNSVAIHIEHPDGSNTAIVIPQFKFTEASIASGSGTLNSELSYSATGNTNVGGTIAVYTDWS